MAVPETMVPSSSHMSVGFHEVFISHRGIEMKKGFASCLYYALRARGIDSFLDSEEFREGDDVREYLLEAIRRASIHVPIFSKIYGTSPWCVDELVEMLDRRRNRQGKVIPVFYDVGPEMLREETGPFAERLGTYLHNCKCEEERMKRWKDALKEASYLAGFEPQKYGGSEGALIEALVTKIRDEVNDSCSVGTVPEPVGLDVKIQDVVQRFRLHEKTCVYVVLIWGTGGVGKTTFAQAIYDLLKKEFEGASFLENCCSDKAIHIQNRLRKDLLLDSDMGGHIARGRKRLEDGLRKKKVLIVLDNMMNDFGDVEKLIDLPHLCPGSLILLTSRNARVYPHKKDFNSSFQGDIYELPKMDNQNSRQLFCHHAFRSVNVDPGFEKVATEALEACDGLPLALEVLGRYLSTMKTEKQWIEAVIKLRNSKHKGITDRLRISYDDLGEDEQQMFLDVACFLIGKYELDAKYFWDALGFGCETGLEELKQRCLVKLGEDGSLTMHDLLRDLGRDISRSSKTRLCNDEDLQQLIDSNQGLDQIRGVATSLPSLDVRVLSKMESLQLLFLDTTKLNGSWNGRKCPRIRWLKWTRCPHETLPEHLSSQSLALLTLVFEKEGFSEFPSIITESKNLKFLEIGKLNSLLGDDVHQLQNFGSLECLAFSEMNFITTLPYSFGQLKRLRVLAFRKCHLLEELPEDIGSLESLVWFHASDLKSITKLPSSFGQLKRLRCLTLKGCDRLEELPEDLGRLESLRFFEATHLKSITKLPSSLGQLKRLWNLNLEGCDRLEEVPEDLGSLESLQFFWALDLKSITKLPSSFGQLKSLRFLIINGCNRLEEVPEDVGSLQRLELLEAFKLKTITKLPSSLGQLKSLRVLKIGMCDRLEELPEDIGSLETLQELEAYGLNSISKLPSSLGQLKRLWRLDIHGCEGLEELPEDFGCLESLEVLEAWGLKSITKLPSSFAQLKKLEVLDIGECDGLEELPKDFGALESLKRLRASARLSSVTEILPSSLETRYNDADKPLLWQVWSRKRSFKEIMKPTIDSMFMSIISDQPTSYL